MTNPLENLTTSVPSWSAEPAFGEPEPVGGQEFTTAARAGRSELP